MNTKYTAAAVEVAEQRLKKAALIEEALEGIDGLDPLDFLFEWYYEEAEDVAARSDGERRDAALAWLRRHNEALQAIARHVRLRTGETVTVRKIAEFGNFGLKLSPNRAWVRVTASVPEALTCELVPTGEFEQVEKMERRCPESIFAGITDDLEVVS